MKIDQTGQVTIYRYELALTDAEPVCKGSMTYIPRKAVVEWSRSERGGVPRESLGITKTSGPRVLKSGELSDHIVTQSHYHSQWSPTPDWVAEIIRGCGMGELL